MRRRTFIPLLISAVLGLSGCNVGNMTSSHGQADQAYIYLASNRKYKDMAQVVIDNQTRFDAKVNKEKKHQVKGETYAVATGKRHIKVLYHNQVVYERTVFLAAQETHQIMLP